jgi:hypothetical protein
MQMPAHRSEAQEGANRKMPCQSAEALAKEGQSAEALAKEGLSAEALAKEGLTTGAKRRWVQMCKCLAWC